jgi:hypothetical protein
MECSEDDELITRNNRNIFTIPIYIVFLQFIFVPGDTLLSCLQTVFLKRFWTSLSIACKLSFAKMRMLRWMNRHTR